MLIETYQVYIKKCAKKCILPWSVLLSSSSECVSLYSHPSNEYCFLTIASHAATDLQKYINVIKDNMIQVKSIEKHLGKKTTEEGKSTLFAKKKQKKQQQIDSFEYK